jgi:hypothetical protein
MGSALARGTLLGMAEDHDSEPTQLTQPKKGKPIEIPVPKREDIENLLSRSARPLPVPDEPESHGQDSEDH